MSVKSTVSANHACPSRCRKSGYTKGDSTQQTVTTAYGTDGRISGAGFLHGGQEKLFTYGYLQGSHLLQTLTKPNGMTLTQTYEQHRDLLTQMDYKRGNTLVVRRSYQYDTLGRPTSRTLARQGATRNDVFTYNDRSELISDVVDGTGLNGWDYDNIGNRLVQQQGSACDTYTSNALNQYTAIEDETHDVFTPTYDDDGNQTRIKTSTGIWNVTYNAKNRPVLFSKEGENLTVACTYDYMGRRATKVVTENGVVTTSHRFLYRGYLQIACCDRTRATHPCLWLITWDPTQPIATRPLAIQKDSTWHTYGWDLTKNVWEVYGTTGYIGTAYTYTAYGKVTANGTINQSIQWSSEYNDTELGLVYYNFRHYNTLTGSWSRPDTVQHGDFFTYCKNKPTCMADFLGNESFTFDKQNCNLSLNAKVKLDFINEEHSQWDSESKNQYKTNLKKAIEGIFNSNNFKLKPKQTCCPCSSGIKMVVNIYYVESWSDLPDWRVNVYAGNRGLRQASSTVGFHLIFPAVGNLYADSYKKNVTHAIRRSDGSIKEIRNGQLPAAHEFGHALGLDHPGEGLVGDKNNPNIPIGTTVYNYKGLDIKNHEVDGTKDLMGLGNDLRAFYFDLWKEYMNNENKNCGYDVE